MSWIKSRLWILRHSIGPQVLISEKIQGETFSAGLQDQSLPLEHCAKIVESETINLKALEALLLALAKIRT